MPSISRRASTVPYSPIRRLATLSQQAEDEGVTVYHLNLGEPDTAPPDSFVRAMRNWNGNALPYEQSQGDKELISAIQRYYRLLSITIEATHVQVTTGGSEAIAFAMAAAADPGESIAVFEPFYANYVGFAAQLGIHVTPIPTSAKTGYHLPGTQEILNRLEPNVRALLLCNPNNPTGTVYTKQEISMCVNICKQKNVFVIADEVYREYCYEDTHHSILQEKGVDDMAIVVDSFSKRFSLCGARVGVLISRNADIMSAALRMAQTRLSSPTLEMTGVAKMLKSEKISLYVQNMVQTFRTRRDLVYDALSRIPGATSRKPEGAFYVLTQLPISDADAFCQWLLTDFRHDNSTVMLAPGAGFYLTAESGKNEVRIAYVLERHQLQKALQILSVAVRAYMKLTKT